MFLFQILLYFLSYPSLELILSSVRRWRNGFFMEGLGGLGWCVRYLITLENHTPKASYWSGRAKQLKNHIGALIINVCLWILILSFSYDCSFPFIKSLAFLMGGLAPLTISKDRLLSFQALMVQSADHFLRSFQFLEALWDTFVEVFGVQVTCSSQNKAVMEQITRSYTTLSSEIERWLFSMLLSL